MADRVWLDTPAGWNASDRGTRFFVTGSDVNYYVIAEMPLPPGLIRVDTLNLGSTGDRERGIGLYVLGGSPQTPVDLDGGVFIGG